MATEPSAQRVYRAACPNCGAPVEFRSAASAFAVCSFCRSTVVRDGDSLRRIGQSAELFEDHSPLQLHAAGRYRGTPFTLVGRLQYRYAEGTWNEWHALFDVAGGPSRSGWLSEDNGRYVFAFDAPLTTPVPPAAQLTVGAPLTVDGQRWTVASVVAARLGAAEGELPRPPDLERGFTVADVRNANGEVGTIDYADAARPAWSVGRSVELADLALTGLREAAEKSFAGRSFACPNCGASLRITLATTQAIVCHQCKSVINLHAAEQGQVGETLRFYAQENGGEPQIPLGSVGLLALGTKEPLPWQVVGYVERVELPEEADDEQTFWREYLLYHRGAGFAFLVDADDGWSWTAPITGAPEPVVTGVRYAGVFYRKLYEYTGQTTYVLGEFYWRLKRDDRTRNVDYQGTGRDGGRRLNREETADQLTAEVVWSAGETLDAEAVSKAFRLAPEKTAALRRDAAPTAFDRRSLLAKVFFWIFIVCVVLLFFKCGSGAGDCSDTRDTFGEASQEYQNCLANQRSGGGYRGSGGGSFGGFSSGGGHK